MDERTFRRLEGLCKAAWFIMSITGQGYKPQFLADFEYMCPACTIANSTKKSDYCSCSLCPIDCWREQKDAELYDGSICDSGKRAYERWRCAIAIEERKQAAKEIYKMKWSYLPEYAGIAFLSHDSLPELEQIAILQITEVISEFEL